MTGTLTAPGILPRSLDLIFNSVSPQQMSSLELRPKNFSEAIYLTEEEAASELTRRESILNKVCVYPSLSPDLHRGLATIIVQASHKLAHW